MYGKIFTGHDGTGYTLPTAGTISSTTDATESATPPKPSSPRFFRYAGAAIEIRKYPPRKPKAPKVPASLKASRISSLNTLVRTTVDMKISIDITVTATCGVSLVSCEEPTELWNTPSRPIG